MVVTVVVVIVVVVVAVVVEVIVNVNSPGVPGVICGSAPAADHTLFVLSRSLVMIIYC